MYRARDVDAKYELCKSICRNRVLRKLIRNEEIEIELFTLANEWVETNFPFVVTHQFGVGNFDWFKYNYQCECVLQRRLMATEIGGESAVARRWSLDYTIYRQCQEAIQRRNVAKDWENNEIRKHNCHYKRTAVAMPINEFYFAPVQLTTGNCAIKWFLSFIYNEL